MAEQRSPKPSMGVRIPLPLFRIRESQTGVVCDFFMGKGPPPSNRTIFLPLERGKPEGAAVNGEAAVCKNFVKTVKIIKCSS